MALFDENCQFLEEFLPYGKALVQNIKNVTDEAYKLEGKYSVDTLNLKREGRNIYENGALNYAIQETTNYLNNPTRFYITKPIVGIERGKIASRFRKHLYDHVGGWSYFDKPSVDAGYGIIFGLGLGTHIDFLAKYLPVEHFVLAETDLVQFAASCKVYSWKRLISNLHDMGKKVSLYVVENPDHLGNIVMNEMRDENHVFLDGSYFYQHGVDFDGSLKRARRTFDEALVTLEYSMGFFEDECLMFKNTMANLAKSDFYLIPKKPLEKAGLPAIVAGSGPSIDGAINSIKANEHKAILFSGGTSYSVLKRNGITPDFHTQYENDIVNYDVIKSFAKDFSFKDTYLVAPMTVDPRIPPYFKGVLFYFRDALSPTMLLASDDQIVTQSGPTVSNLGCRAALSMGAETLILFGVDLGGPSEEEHHSKDTIYIYEKDTVTEFSGHVLGALPDSTPQKIPVAGNHHEIVYTNRIFMQARMYFESMFLGHNHVPVYNCSNGVRIEGVIDMLPEQLEIIEQPTKKEELREKLLNSWQHYAAGDYVKPHHLDDFERALQDIICGLEGLCADDAPLVSMQEFLKEAKQIALIGQRSESATTENAAKTLILGSLLQILQTGHYLYRRALEEQQAEFMRIFRRELRPYLQEFRDTSKLLIDEARGNISTL